MSDEERRAVAVTAGILLLASLLRLVWESRPTPPILPPSAIPPTLVEETRTKVEEAERMQTPLAAGERVDPNRDPEVELARLPGIGPALAARIVASRKTEGRFGRPSDLLRVSGIGSATLDRIEPFIELSGPPSEAAQRVGARESVPMPRPVEGDGALVDLNRASESALQELPGVGPTLARRIVEYRARSGGFSAVDQLAEIAGIGSATLDRLRRFVRVSR